RNSNRELRATLRVVSQREMNIPEIRDEWQMNFRLRRRTSGTWIHRNKKGKLTCGEWNIEPEWHPRFISYGRLPS
ncbi:MAG: hypothetical protein ABI164_10690, partial [Acidobacteriaceae bacterium]